MLQGTYKMNDIPQSGQVSQEVRQHVHRRLCPTPACVCICPMLTRASPLMLAATPVRCCLTRRRGEKEERTTENAQLLSSKGPVPDTLSCTTINQTIHILGLPCAGLEQAVGPHSLSRQETPAVPRHGRGLRGGALSQHERHAQRHKREPRDGSVICCWSVRMGDQGLLQECPVLRWRRQVCCVWGEGGVECDRDYTETCSPLVWLTGREAQIVLPVDCLHGSNCKKLNDECRDDALQELFFCMFEGQCTGNNCLQTTILTPCPRVDVNLVLLSKCLHYER